MSLNCRSSQQTGLRSTTSLEASIHRGLARLAGSRLPLTFRRELEAFFEADLSRVRVLESNLAVAMGARAFARGPLLVFRPGTLDPASLRGRALLAHELTHVLQQRDGRVPSPRDRPGAIVLDPSLEAEADLMGRCFALGLRAPADRPAAGRFDPGLEPIQPCLYCGDLLCSRGEKCKQGSSFGGLFESGLSTPHVGPHKETKKHSKKNVFESEHMVPKQALKKSGVKFSYNDEPTISIPYEMHRGGQSGVGGGVSSTGSSETATTWSESLAKHIKNNDWKTAIKLTATDEFLSAAQNGYLTSGMVSAIMQNVNYHATMGRITDTDAGEIKNMLMSWLLDFQEKGHL
jgi:hypothetical protein